MAASKAPQAFTWASGSATASGTTNPLDCSTDYAQDVYVSIGVTGGPSVGASFIIQVSPDGGTTWYNMPSFTAGLSTITYYWTPIALPVTATKVQIIYTNQTGGTSTLVAQLGQVTGI